MSTPQRARTLEDAIRLGKPIEGTGISGELFCLVFQFFFKDALARFVTTIVAGKVRLAIALLHAIDPAGKITDWVGSRSPRSSRIRPRRRRAGRQAISGRPGQGLIGESAERALGIR
jgi:hypothetical protein